MTAQPTWSPVDDGTASLLDLLADDGTVSTDYEWEVFAGCLRGTAKVSGGVINPNVLRTAIRGRVKAQRVGAFYRRAVLEGLVEYTGEWVTSTDSEGRNAGKPCRSLRWIGGAL